MPRLENIYNFLQQENKITVDFNAFKNKMQYGDYQEKVFNFVKERKKYSKDLQSFKGQYGQRQKMNHVEDMKEEFKDARHMYIEKDFTTRMNEQYKDADGNQLVQFIETSAGADRFKMKDMRTGKYSEEIQLPGFQGMFTIPKNIRWDQINEKVKKFVDNPTTPNEEFVQQTEAAKTEILKKFDGILLDLGKDQSILQMSENLKYLDHYATNGKYIQKESKGGGSEADTDFDFIQKALKKEVGDFGGIFGGSFSPDGKYNQLNEVDIETIIQGAITQKFKQAGDKLNADRSEAFASLLKAEDLTIDKIDKAHLQFSKNLFTGNKQAIDLMQGIETIKKYKPGTKEFEDQHKINKELLKDYESWYEYSTKFLVDFSTMDAVDPADPTQVAGGVKITKEDLDKQEEKIKLTYGDRIEDAFQANGHMKTLSDRQGQEEFNVTINDKQAFSIFQQLGYKSTGKNDKGYEFEIKLKDLAKYYDATVKSDGFAFVKSAIDEEDLERAREHTKDYDPLNYGRFSRTTMDADFEYSEGSPEGFFGLTEKLDGQTFPKGVSKGIKGVWNLDEDEYTTANWYGGEDKYLDKSRGFKRLLKTYRDDRFEIIKNNKVLSKMHLLNIDPTTTKSMLPTRAAELIYEGTAQVFGAAAATPGVKAPFTSVRSEKDIFENVANMYQQWDDKKKTFTQESIPLSEKQKESIRRSGPYKVYEGVAGFVPMLAEFFAIDLAINKGITVIPHLARVLEAGRKIAAGQQKGSRLQKTLYHTYGMVKEEFKVRQAFDQHYHMGGGAGFYAVGTFMPWFKMGNVGIGATMSSITKSGLAGAVSSQAAMNLESLVKDIKGGENYMTFIKENYSDLSETSQDFLVDFFTFAIVGGKGYVGKKHASYHWKTMSKVRKVQGEFADNILKWEKELKELDKDSPEAKELENKIAESMETFMFIQNRLPEMQEIADWQDVEKATEKLNKIGGNLKKLFGEDFTFEAVNERTNPKTGESYFRFDDSKAEVSGDGKKIYVDVTQVTPGTMPHEVFHMGMKKLFKENPEVLRKFKEGIADKFKGIEYEVDVRDNKGELTGEKKMMGLEDMIKNEHGHQKDFNEIKDHEFMAYVAEALANPMMYSKYAPKGVFGGIKRDINRFSNRNFGTNVFETGTKQDVIDFLYNFGVSTKNNNLTNKQLDMFKKIRENGTFAEKVDADSRTLEEIHKQEKAKIKEKQKKQSEKVAKKEMPSKSAELSSNTQKVYDSIVKGKKGSEFDAGVEKMIKPSGKPGKYPSVAGENFDNIIYDLIQEMYSSVYKNPMDAYTLALEMVYNLEKTPDAKNRGVVGILKEYEARKDFGVTTRKKKDGTTEEVKDIYDSQGDKRLSKKEIKELESKYNAEFGTPEFIEQAKSEGYKGKQNVTKTVRETLIDRIHELKEKSIGEEVYTESLTEMSEYGKELVSEDIGGFEFKSHNEKLREESGKKKLNILDVRNGEGDLAFGGREGAEALVKIRRNTTAILTDVKTLNDLRSSVIADKITKETIDIVKERVFGREPGMKKREYYDTQKNTFENSEKYLYEAGLPENRDLSTSEATNIAKTVYADKKHGIYKEKGEFTYKELNQGIAADILTDSQKAEGRKKFPKAPYRKGILTDVTFEGNRKDTHHKRVDIIIPHVANTIAWKVMDNQLNNPRFVEMLKTKNPGVYEGLQFESVLKSVRQNIRGVVPEGLATKNIQTEAEIFAEKIKSRMAARPAMLEVIAANDDLKPYKEEILREMQLGIDDLATTRELFIKVGEARRLIGIIKGEAAKPMIFEGRFSGKEGDSIHKELDKLKVQMKLSAELLNYNESMASREKDAKFSRQWIEEFAPDFFNTLDMRLVNLEGKDRGGLGTTFGFGDQRFGFRPLVDRKSAAKLSKRKLKSLSDKELLKLAEAMKDPEYFRPVQTVATEFGFESASRNDLIKAIQKQLATNYGKPKSLREMTEAQVIKIAELMKDPEYFRPVQTKLTEFKFESATLNDLIKVIEVQRTKKYSKDINKILDIVVKNRRHKILDAEMRNGIFEGVEGKDLKNDKTVKKLLKKDKFGKSLYEYIKVNDNVKVAKIVDDALVLPEFQGIENPSNVKKRKQYTEHVKKRLSPDKTLEGYEKMLEANDLMLEHISEKMFDYMDNAIKSGTTEKAINNLAYLMQIQTNLGGGWFRGLASHKSIMLTRSGNLDLAISKRYRSEHQFQLANLTGNLLLNTLKFSGNKKGFMDNTKPLIREYKQSIINKELQEKIDGAEFGGKLANIWSEKGMTTDVPSEANYLLERSIMESIVDLKSGQTYAEILDGRLKSGAGFKKLVEISKKHNLPSKNVTESQMARNMRIMDKAIANGRRVNKERKGMSTWDFDDTLATTKSGVRARIPNPEGTPKPNRKVVFLAGGAGSGKGNVIEKLGLEKDGFKIVNQDISLEWLKKNNGLPENMNDLTKEQRSKLGTLQHQARGIAKRKMMKYQGNADGVVVDGTGGSIKAMEKLVKEFSDKGYDVSMLFVETSLKTALERNKARKERSLLDKIVEKNHISVQANKKGFKTMFSERFMEVKTDDLKQEDAMPRDLVDKMDNFVKSYEKIRLDAEEFATQGKDVLDKGGEFDFAEFNVVTGGQRGPFFEKALDRVKKFGTEHQYVLTARPPEAVGPIHEFLKSQGLNIPIENITGLGNSTGEAKAMWMLEKFSEGYNDMYFADDAMQNVKAVKDVLERVDAKSKVVQAKSINEVKNIDKLDSPDAYENVLASKKHRTEYEKTISKYRPDLVKERLVSKTVDGMFDFIEELNLPPNKKRKYEQVTTKWLATSNIKLKEDGYKIKDAVELAEKHKEDIFSYNNPNGIIEKYAGKAKAKPTDPNTVKEFTKVVDYDFSMGKEIVEVYNKKYGIKEYIIGEQVSENAWQESKESQLAVREVMDTHFGENSNPWCLTQKKNGKLTENSWEMWEHYSDGPKSLVFQNGKLIGFKANGEYWDRMDNATDAPVITVKEGRVTKMVELVPINGKVSEFVAQTKTTSKDKKTVTTEYHEEKSIDPEGYYFHPAGTKIVENKVNGITVRETVIKPNGKTRRITKFKDGKEIESRSFQVDGKTTMSINSQRAIDVEKHGDSVSHEIIDGKTEYWFGTVSMEAKGLKDVPSDHQHGGKNIYPIGFKTPVGFEVMDVMKRIDGKLRVNFDKLHKIDPDVKGLPKEVLKPVAREGMQTLEPVKKVLDQLDVKSETQQALASKNAELSSNINKILERSLGIEAQKRFSAAEAKVRGKDIKRRRLIMPDTAADLELLIEPLYSKGKKGVEDKEWFEENFYKPWERGVNDLNTARQKTFNGYADLRKLNKDTVKDLQKEVEGTSFTNDMAARVYLYNRAGFEVPGLTKSSKEKLIQHVIDNPKLRNYAETVARLTGIETGLNKPKESWWAETLATEIQDIGVGVSRKRFLQDFIDIKNEIFSPENLNKMESKLGTRWRETIEDMFDRMETGRTRSMKLGTGGAEVMNYLNGSVGTIMNLNTRSATLQLISSVNFINHTENNPLAASRAFLNQKQYWKDFMTIMNSDMLVQRRAGLKINVTEQELASAAAKSQNKARAAIAWILKQGYIPTKIADSFAIASGGSTYYRNRIKMYEKQGLSTKEAERKAWVDFQGIAEKTQQSSRPDLLSQQQTSFVGRLILPFANTPMQMNRIMVKEFLDLSKGRYEGYFGENSFTNKASKIAYYGVIQSMIFAGLQSALFATMGFDPDSESIDDKKARSVNTVLDSFLRGMGWQTAVISSVKNAILEFQKQNEKGYGADYDEVIEDLLNVSPTIGSKYSKLDAMGNTYKYNKKEILEKGISLDNTPALEMAAQGTEAIFNIPVHRMMKKADNIQGALNEQHESWQRVLMGLGWGKWDVGAEDYSKSKKKEDKKDKEDKKVNKKIIRSDIRF